MRSLSCESIKIPVAKTTNVLPNISPKKQDKKGEIKAERDQKKLDLAITRHLEFVVHIPSAVQDDDDIAQEAISSIAQALKEAVEHTVEGRGQGYGNQSAVDILQQSQLLEHHSTQIADLQKHSQ